MGIRRAARSGAAPALNARLRLVAAQFLLYTSPNFRNKAEGHPQRQSVIRQRV